MKNFVKQLSMPLICAQIVLAGPVAAAPTPTSTEYKICSSLNWMSQEEEISDNEIVVGLTAGILAIGGGIKAAYAVRTSKPRIERFKEYLAIKKMSPEQIELNYLKLQREHFTEMAAGSAGTSIRFPGDRNGNFVAEQLDQTESHVSKKKYLTTQNIAAKADELHDDFINLPKSKQLGSVQQENVLNLMRIDKEEMMRITSETPEFKGKTIKLDSFYGKVAESYGAKISQIEAGSKIQPLQFSDQLAQKYGYVRIYNSSKASTLANASSKLKKAEALKPARTFNSFDHKLNYAGEGALATGVGVGLLGLMVPLINNAVKNEDTDAGVFEMYEFLPTLKKNYPEEFKRWKGDINLCMKELSKKAELLDIMDNWNESHKQMSALKKAKVDNSERSHSKAALSTDPKEKAKPSSKTKIQ